MVTSATKPCNDAGIVLSGDGLYFVVLLEEPQLTPLVKEALRCYDEIVACVSKGQSFEPLNLTDHNRIEDVAAAAKSLKGFAFNHGVSDIRSAGTAQVLAAMEEHDVLLCVHGEVNIDAGTSKPIDILELEQAFIDNELTYILDSFLRLRVVLEHVTTQEAVQLVTAYNEQHGAKAKSKAKRTLTSKNDTRRKDRAQLLRCREVLLVQDISPTLAAAIAGEEGKDPIGPCVVLELLGVSLIHFEHVRKRRKVAISLLTIRFIALQLLNALAFLHALGNYIHADLKPENVVVSMQHSLGDSLLTNAHPDVKIVDLGNALSMGREVSTFEVQSLHYRAPELVLGNEMMAAIDIWSIGCILIELTGGSEHCRGLAAAKQKESNG